MAAVDPNVDPVGYLGMTRNPDGSITRLPGPPPLATPASSDPSNNPFHFTKDVTINESNGNWARLFVPRETFASSPLKKLPLIIYFHGGGFVVMSVSTPLFDDFYKAIVTELPAVVVSVEHRLAPEHRLPAAYDDCMEALYWIKNSKDEWLTKYADLSNTFLMGTSSGGNIAYNLCLRVSACVDDLMPLQIKGLILNGPFFGGTQRTDSELRLANDKLMPLCATDLMWELCLPVGVDRDHEYCNPTVGIKSHQFDHIKALGWKVLVTGCYGDPLSDRQIELVKILEEHGVLVLGKFEKGGSHAHEFFDPSKAKALCIILKEFTASSSTS
ncbi:hypothetical protein ACH5RR_040514 [Cinchona calisaya]|uniref:Alpha/beta hydrolase fold-3 domain-containing protein n=1 Tax=Cinchona calisaya TaxID=153742 RepID=A0ABD2XU32_9GENT